MPKSCLRYCLVLSFFVFLGTSVFGQTTAQPDAKGVPDTVPVDGKDLPSAAEYVKKQFGADYVLDPKMTTLLGDLDGDGEEDAIFVVTGGNPLLGGEAFNYKVVDPYNSYWAIGTPSVTAHLGQVEPGPVRCLLIAHSWRSPEPKMKFAIVNLPFVKVTLTPTYNKKRKRTVAAIATVERDGQMGAVIWKGNGYKFVQLGNVNE